MSSFPDEFLSVMIAYSGLFSKPVFAHARLLLAGAILAPGKRTVTSVLRVLGLGQETKFHKYHRVLSLARWCALKGAGILLGQLLGCFLAEGPVVVGIDETIGRRWGGKIRKRGIYRDSVRSSHSLFVKCSGLRWVSLMLLLPIGWAGRVWALPFLTVLAPSERYASQAGNRHKKVTDWARQMLLQLKRWLPGRQVIAVGDNSYAVLELLAAVRSQVTFITRLRLDAALYEPGPCARQARPQQEEGAKAAYPARGAEEYRYRMAEGKAEQLVWPRPERNGDSHGNSRLVPQRKAGSAPKVGTAARPGGETGTGGPALY